MAACTQHVHVKPAEPGLSIAIAGQNLGVVPKEGVEVEVATGFGPVSTSNGKLPRSQLNGWAHGFSIGGAAVASPLLAFAGILVANPAWIMAPAILYQGQGWGAFGAYLAQTMSFWTLPIATGFALIGLLPLLGLLRVEQLPSSIEIAKGPFAP